MPIPEGYSEVFTLSFLKYHHEGIRPKLLRSTSSFVGDWMIFCPGCGHKIMGQEKEDLITKWNNII